ncbi:hypothetical protein BJY18_003412 [Amycolatopsis jiangsuensis]|uniref:Uncharacterized protein n=1 Tax=Amycolatopsis jiangsuensis TaxID=1181879 RepID=A0A840IXA2_9PSEU|nr:hypothetical protein [Amycolatopsis jiangsuensis]
MNGNYTLLMSPGTGLSVGVDPAQRQGTGVSAACFGAALRRIERTWTPAGTTRVSAVVAVDPQVDVDLPTIKQFRVPLSLRERSP